MESYNRVIDLHTLIPLFGRILINIDTELELIKLYQYLQLTEESTLFNFTNYIINTISHSNDKYPFIDINKFYKERDYIDKVMFFIDTLNTILYNQIGTNFVDIKFKSIVKYQKELSILDVEFEVFDGIIYKNSSDSLSS